MTSTLPAGTAGPAPSLPDSSLSDGDLCVALANGAGKVLLGLRRSAPDHTDPAFDGRAFKDEGDAASQEWLATALAHSRPEDVVLSEEAKDDKARLHADRVWIIDPLDGTREFSERDDQGVWRDDFAVHVALWTQKKGLTDGAVSLPARGTVFSTVRPHALPSAAEEGAALRIAASRSRPPEFVARLAAGDEITLVPMGSAGVKVVSVITGTVDAYVHGGGQYEWDSAAPVAVAQAAGLTCTRLDGSSLEYNRADPWLPDLCVTHPDGTARVSSLLNSVGVAHSPKKAGDR